MTGPIFFIIRVGPIHLGPKLLASARAALGASLAMIRLQHQDETLHLSIAVFNPGIPSST